MVRSNSYFLKLTLILLLILGGVVSLASQYISSPKSVKAAVDSSETSLPTIPIATASATVNTNSSEGTFVLRVPILMYHYVRAGIPITDQLSYRLSVTPAVLEEQLKYLADNGYIAISLVDLDISLENRLPLPPKSVVLTFDDGYRDFYTSAFPLLKKYNLRAVSFYVVDYANYPGYMSWDMVKEIQASGLVDVESHTLSHSSLSKLDSGQKTKEIFESKKILEQKLEKKVNYFAYPYGDFDDSVVQLVQQAGYHLAFGTNSGTRHTRGEKFFLKRVAVNGEDSFETFKYKLDSY